MADTFKFGIDVELGPAQRKLEDLTKQIRRLIAATKETGDTTNQRAGSDLYKKLKTDAETYDEAIKRLTSRLNQAKQAQQEVAAGAEKVKLTDSGTINLPGGASVDRVRATGGVIAKDENIQKLIDQIPEVEAQLANMYASAARYLNGIDAEFQDIDKSAEAFNQKFRQVQEVLNGSTGTDVLTAQIRSIDQEISRLIQRKAELDVLPLRNLGQRGEARANSILAARDREVERINGRIAKIKAEAAREGVQGTQRELELTEQLLNERINLARAEEKARPEQARKDALKELLGTDVEDRQIDAAIQRLQKIRQDIFDARLNQDFSRLGPTYQKEIILLQKVKDQLDKTNLSEARRNQLLREQDKILDRIEQDASRQASKSFQQNIPQSANNLPGFERTLFGAFDDFNRRFVTTLQFAISGALIFGVQQFLREFFRTAVEVERTFQDIATAFEFDIDAPRGSDEFEKEVRNIRLEVLALADDFNTLPSEANRSTFVMVSRFQDMGNALQAVRSQLLATKISTISQEETLRALTAVAEAVAAATIETTAEMELNERIMLREAAAADAYARALDLAAFSQQRFGGEVEDSLEGMARAAPTLTQMGFTLEEVNALVTAVSVNLGQTGQQIAERLNRSIGQLSAPQVKDELLELARLSDNFFLTEADFSSGAEAWRLIVSQFQQLQNVEPKVAEQILQIIGQRRELEAVAAALNTTDVQRQIVAESDTAIGAAERRYEQLRNTFEEILASIAANFEELAQNVAQSGFLEPIKTILKAADSLLTTVNALLRAFESWPDSLRQTIVIMGSILTIMRGLIAAETALTYARAARLRADTELGVTEARGQFGQAVGRIGPRLSGGAGILGAFRGFGKGLKESISAIGGFKAAAIGLTLAMVNGVVQLTASAKTINALFGEIDQQRADARTRGELAGKTETEIAFDEARAEFQTVSNAPRGGIGFFGREINKAFSGVLARFSEDFRELEELGAELAGFSSVENYRAAQRFGLEPITGSDEWWERLLELAEGNFYEAGIKAITEDIAGVDLPDDVDTANDPRFRKIFTELDRARRSQDPQREYEALVAYYSLLAEAGAVGADLVEGAISKLKDRLSSIQLENEASGSVTQQIEQTLGLRDEGIEQLRAATSAGNLEGIEIATEFLREINVELQSLAQKAFQQRLATIGLIESETVRLEEIAQGYADEYARITEDFFNNEANAEQWAEAYRAMVEARRAADQARFEGIQAFRTSGVSPRDAVRGLETDLYNLVEELERLEEAGFGELDTAWSTVRKQILSTSASIEDSLIELAALNARKDIDISSQLESLAVELAVLEERLALDGLGDLERAQLEDQQRQTELNAIGAFFDRRLLDLEFAFAREEIGEAGYLASLRQLLAQVDVTTEDGMRTWLQIQGLIDGMTNDLSDLAFNIPTEIQLPTLYEVRRAIAGDASEFAGNYMDNRTQTVVVNVDQALDSEETLQAFLGSIGDSITFESTQFSAGSSTFSGLRY